MNKFKKLFSLTAIFIMLNASFAFAQDEDYMDMFEDIGEEETTESPGTTSTEISAPDFELSLTGDHIFEFHAPVVEDELDFEGPIKTPKFKNEFGVDIKYKDLKLVSHWMLDLHITDGGEWSDFIKARPLENALYYSPWKFKFGVGFQEYTWGVADGSNPTDNINPRDLSVGVESDKITVFSGSINFYPTDFMSIEAVYVPFEQADIFPVDLVAKLEDQLSSFGTDVMVKDFDFDPRAFLMGGKVNFFFSMVDFSFSYLYDYDKFYTPDIELQKAPIPGQEGLFPSIYAYVPKTVELERKRIHRIGADVKLNIDRFGIWLEGAYSLSEDYMLNNYKIRNHTLGWTAGMDFNYGPQDTFYFNVQFIGDWTPKFYKSLYEDYYDDDHENQEIDLEDMMDKDYMEEFYYKRLTQRLGSEFAGLNLGLMLKFEWPVLDDMITPSLVGGYFLPLEYEYEHETKYGGLYLNPELDVMPIDSFHIRLGADLMYAWHKVKGEEVEIDEDSSRLGLFNKDSNVYIELAYKWGYDLKK